MRGVDTEAPRWSEYALLDSGDRRKLERFGSVVLVRPEQKAWWRPDLPEEAWQGARARLEEDGRWRVSPGQAREWTVTYQGLTVGLRLSDTTRHVGVFPEQEPHWRWVMNHAPPAPQVRPSLLCLFGYTGMASLVAASCGFSVTHVDASKPAIAWARANQARSGMSAAPIRWIVDDALTFVKRELRRGNRYQAVIMDPPSFGRGPKGQVWKVETHLVELMEAVARLLDEAALFLVVTIYNLEASSLMLANLMDQALGQRSGCMEVGELVLPHQHSPKVLPLALYGRWWSRDQGQGRP